ncbi:MAG: serine/threonine-protein phosphatase, partial [Clostridia bacterium]|nr:serine/threonine-protein phosphatase [Clostridia bacterium]
MKKIRANVCAVTHAGRIRRENEDNYDLNGRMTSTGDLRKGSAFVQTMAEPFHLSVCDGMGGESYGELASGIAVETIAAHAANVYESGEDFSFAISNCLDDANSRICAEINARGKRMGTTLAAVYAVKGKIICTNIGDTRIYHYSKGVLEQISFDHTHAQTIVDAGEAAQNDIGRIPDAKRLTKHLGVFPEEATLSPNISVIDDVDNGDIILLCSDGLTDMLSDEDITAILSTGESSQDVASKLIRSALERGGKDNVTVMAALLDVEETAIFAPIAAAMVGDTDADYEEEYRNSF